MTPELRTDLRRDGDTATLHLHGELDLATSPVLRAGLTDLATDPPAALVVDVAGLSFLDSTGISVLVDAYNTQRRRGAGLRVSRPTPAVRRVLAVAGLLDLFGVEADPAGSDGTGRDGEPEG